MAEVPRPRDEHWPMLGEAELAADLMDEVGDVVPDAARAIGTQVGKVLAHLGGVHAGRLGQITGRDGGRAALSHLDQRSQIHGQPTNGRFRDGPVSHRAAGAVTGSDCSCRHRAAQSHKLRREWPAGRA